MSAFQRRMASRPSSMLQVNRRLPCSSGKRETLDGRVSPTYAVFVQRVQAKDKHCVKATQPAAKGNQKYPGNRLSHGGRERHFDRIHGGMLIVWKVEMKQTPCSVASRFILLTSALRYLFFCSLFIKAKNTPHNASGFGCAADRVLA